jgi:aminoglycoside 2'-N-acetyltransferase I
VAEAVRAVPREELSSAELAALLELAREPWPHLSDTYWEDVGVGVHFVIEEDGEPVSQACVVELELHVEDRAIRTGYVEAVSTRSDRRSRGLATRLMGAVHEHIRSTFELGALDTGLRGFYERWGWRRWRGPTWVRAPDGPLRTEEEDGNVYVLATPRTPPDLDLDAPISAPWRPPESW